jgi:hypothetical protein
MLVDPMRPLTQSMMPWSLLGLFMHDTIEVYRLATQSAQPLSEKVCLIFLQCSFQIQKTVETTKFDCFGTQLNLIHNCNRPLNM